MPTFVIIGAGLAGAKATEALREQGFDGEIVLFGAEEHLPYERPALSKDYLASTKGIEDFTPHPADWYREHGVDLRLGTEVTSIDRLTHTVAFGVGEQQRYDKLLLATGSRSRRPPIPGGDAAGVHYLRTIDDAASLVAALTNGARLAVIGAGWIGLEVAASARQRGVEVTVVENAELPLLGALGRDAAQVFATLHRDNGVDLRLQTSVREITTEGGTATGLTLDDGSTIAADAVLVAVGAAPNTELAEKSGLTVADGGVVVDASLKTGDDDVYAVGDIASAANPLYGRSIRSEHWAAALKQPAVAVAGMLGNPGIYDELPYFFTDQYDLGMEYVGSAKGHASSVFRGDLDAREFTMFWIDTHGRVLAGMNVNIWDGLDDIKELIRSRRRVDLDKLADAGLPLGDVHT